MSTASPSSKRRPSDGRERGFTLIEVLVALLIVATTIAALQAISNATLKSAVETNRVRVAKMLLREKAEEVLAGLEQGSGGTFDGFPGYSWEVSEIEVPVTPGDTPESVRSVTVTVRMPAFSTASDSSDLPYSEDAPGTVRVTTLLDPPDAELKPPQGAAGAGQQSSGEK